MLRGLAPPRTHTRHRFADAAAVSLRAVRSPLAFALSLAAATACTAQHAGPATPPRPARVVISVVGTNDLHGRLAMLPWLAGHVNNLRAARARDGAVLLVDGGDMFQGTLESNLEEGAAVVRAYNALRYDAVTIGNHEFDYGPAGEATFARNPGDDPRGALRARAREARYPFLTANIVESDGGANVSWENVRPDVTLTVAGVRVGVIGVSTESTPHTTLSVNFRGLAMRPLAETIRARAERLRREGAQAVIVLAHAGGACRNFENPHALDSCDAHEEIFEVANALPEGAVDAIVAGHTHRAVAHVVHGIPVIESYANGRAFGRVDLTVDTATGRVLDRHVFAPHDVCGSHGRDEPDPARCEPADYEGAPVTADRAIADAVAPAIANARTVQDRPLHATVEGTVRNHYRDESALTNLVADLVRAASPGADVALMNAGGVRTDLREGPVDYGRLYNVLPFDNRLVTVRMRASELRAVLARNASSEGGALGVSGVRVAVRCEGDHPVATVTRENGGVLADDAVLTVATNDYLAQGSFARHLAVPLTDDAIVASPTLRDAVATQLGALGTIRGSDTRWYDPQHPRFALPGPRPLRCQ